MLSELQLVLGACSGVIVGFTLSLIGGGGSILAVPLIVYVVGITNPHIAIGTSALSVAVNAATGLLAHVRRNNVSWRCGIFFAGSGIVGALGGSTLGKLVDGQRLLGLFALFMIIIAVRMLKRRSSIGEPADLKHRGMSPKIFGFGAATGLISGFFGIGGGFLVVPGLIAATGMPIRNAIGTSLVVITTFGLTTSLNYAASHYVNWPLAGAMSVGGLAGSHLGAWAGQRLQARAVDLGVVFAILLIIVAVAVLGDTLWALVEA